MVNQFVQGGISGVGVITAVAGLRDLSAAIAARQTARSRPPSPTQGAS